jgi:hypothetical protein
MSCGNLFALGLNVAMLLVSTYAFGDPVEIGCPPMHRGKPLAKVGLFDGPPADLAQLMPRDGGYDVPAHPLSPSLPNFTLGCSYRGLKDVVTVVLPNHVRVCEFANYPQVRCH